MTTTDRKAETRRQIVQSASRLFRARGYLGTSVDELMSGAGLTHGGFYAHFASKSALLAAALSEAFAESRENMLGGRLDGLSGEAWLRAAAARYLAGSHRASPEEGCAIPALGAEVARAPLEVRTAFEAELSRLVLEMATRLGGDRRRALRALSLWAGAMTLARAVADPALAAEILAAARED